MARGVLAPIDTGGGRIVVSALKYSARRKMGWLLTGTLAVGLFGVFLGLVAFGSSLPSPGPEFLPGTAFTVRLVRPVSSENARLGDVFEARLVATDSLKGSPVILPGTRVEGRCVAVRPGESEGRPGYLRLTLAGLRDAAGHFVPLETTTFTLSTRNPSVGEASEAVATPEKDLTFVLLKSAAAPRYGWAL